MRAEDILDLPEDSIKKKLELVILKDRINGALTDVVIRGTVLSNEIIKTSKDLLEDFEKLEKKVL